MYTPRIKTLIPIIAIILGSLLTGCTIQKRKHLSGFHIDWSAKSNRSADKSEDSLVHSPESISGKAPDFSASMQESIEVLPPNYVETVNWILKTFLPKDSCDKILDVDGDEIWCKVTDIELEVIKYKACGHLDGPTYSIPRSSVSQIIYDNGRRESIKPVYTEPKYENVDDIYFDERKGRKSKKIEGSGLAGFITAIVTMSIWWLIRSVGGMIAGLILIVLGSIGIHRCRKNPDLLWGKGFAITALTIGLGMFLVSLIWLVIVV